MSHLLAIAYLRGLYGIASGSLLRHRLRSFLSILGIICGVAAVFATLSIGEGAKREVLAGIRQLGLDNIIVRRVQIAVPQGGAAGANGSRGLHFTDIELLKGASPAIVNLAYLKEIQTDVSGLSREVTPQVVACSPSYLSMLRLGVLRGRLMLRSDESQKKMICILGEDIARELGSQGNVGEWLRIGEQLFLVAGIVKSARLTHSKEKNGVALAREIGQMIFLPFGAHQYLKQSNISTGDSDLDEVIVKTHSEQDAGKIVPLIQRTLEISHQTVRDYQLIVPWQLMNQARKTQRIFNLILTAIGGISLIVGGIGIMNVLLAVISERTREIGIRRAVGATRNDIVAQFLAEALLLTTSGGVAGIFVGFICSLSIARFAGWSVAVTPLTIVIPLLTSVVVGGCSGVYPAIKAGRMDPVQALRSA